jgi:cell division protease FtsH
VLFQTREYLLDRITMSMGGRVSEEIVMKRVGTGAQNDIDNASSLARKMVTKWGMSEKVGPISFNNHEDHPFLGKYISSKQSYSEETAREIDKEVKRIIEYCYGRARKIIEEHIDELHRVAEALLERESLDGEEIKILLEGGTLPDEPAKKKTEEKEEGSGEAEAEEEVGGEPPGEEPSEETGRNVTTGDRSGNPAESGKEADKEE